MRRVLTALAALSLAAVLIPQSAEAQSSGRPGGQQSRDQAPDQGTSQRSRQVRIAGEIEGVSADCVYREADPIRLDFNVLFNLGKGPQASGDARTYRYWVAVTERNSAVLAKEYFDLPVNFEGQTTTSVQQAQSIVIPRADATTAGSNFEVLIGFEITPEMAEFNRSGSRFRVTAGQTQPNP